MEVVRVPAEQLSGEHVLGALAVDEEMDGDLLNSG